MTFPLALLMVAVVALPHVVFGEAIEVDVGAWADVGTGMTAEDWEVKGIGRYSDGGAMFNSASDFALSPEYDDVVTQIVMSVRSSATNVVKILAVVPKVPEGATAYEAKPTFDTYETETFTWEPSERVRQFCLQERSGASGNWGISSLTVYTDRIESPSGLRADSLYRDAFTAGWDPVPRAVRYQVRYASVTRLPPQCKTVAAWDFSSLTNTFGATRDLNQLQQGFPELLGGLAGSNVCMQAYEGGHIQIGKGESLGILVLPCQAEGSDLTGILCAWKYPEDAKTTMPISFVRDGVTNDLATVEIARDRTECRFPFPAGFAADGILLSSTTNGLSLADKNGRVRVESFAIVSDYIPGSVTTNDFKSVGTRVAAKQVKDLGPGEWIWSVRSFDAEGRDSPWSQFRTVILDPRGPCRPSPGFLIQVD